MNAMQNIFKLVQMRISLSFSIINKLVESKHMRKNTETNKSESLEDYETLTSNTSRHYISI